MSHLGQPALESDFDLALALLLGIDRRAYRTAHLRPADDRPRPRAVPQLGLLTLREIGPHAICGLAIKPLRHGEPSMVGSLLDQLGLGMLLIWDRGFFSYPLIRSVNQRGAHLLARVKSKTVLKPLRRLSAGSYLAKRAPGQ